MTTKIKLNINELREALEFYDSLEEWAVVGAQLIEFEKDSSSGIGYTLKASITEVYLKQGSDNSVIVSTFITDVSSW